jgi:hypothetical protein
MTTYAGSGRCETGYFSPSGMKVRVIVADDNPKSLSGKTCCHHIGGWSCRRQLSAANWTFMPKLNEIQ